MRVLLRARMKAGELGAAAIEPEHILLGVLDESEGVSRRILARAGDVDNLRADIVRRLKGGEKRSESDELPFSASCTRVLEYACEEADRLLHGAVGTEHLLVGLLRGEQNVAADVLASKGLTVATVRQAIQDFGRSDEPEPPGPPPTPANTYRWPQVPFVPSRTVHILYSGMQWPAEPVINRAGNVFSAYGFTLEEIVVRAWNGSRWHVDITPGLRDDGRFDFLMVLPHEEILDTCLGLLKSAIEQHFGVSVTRETRVRHVYRLTDAGRRGRMLKRYPDPPPGTGFSSLSFSAFTGRTQHAPMFPLEPFAVHSLPFAFLVSWFEEILDGQVIDEAHLPGIYGFELQHRVNAPDAFIQLLRDDAGLVMTREQRELSTIVVRAP